jgi:hypothetical protein
VRPGISAAPPRWVPETLLLLGASGRLSHRSSPLGRTRRLAGKAAELKADPAACTLLAASISLAAAPEIVADEERRVSASR